MPNLRVLTYSLFPPFWLTKSDIYVYMYSHARRAGVGIFLRRRTAAACRFWRQGNDGGGNQNGNSSSSRSRRKKCAYIVVLVVRYGSEQWRS